jgi:hypothetical protein
MLGDIEFPVNKILLQRSAAGAAAIATVLTEVNLERVFHQFLVPP